MNKKIVVRMVVGLFAIAVMFAAYKWFENWTKDPDRGFTDTTDMIAAVEFTDNGSHIVLFSPDGSKKDVPGFVEERQESDPVWRPDGQRVFFASTRQGQSANIFRWNVATNKVERRLQSSSSASSPFYGPKSWPGLETSGLITMGGNVFEFNQVDQKARQILPPLEFANADEAATSQLQTLYQQTGSSFKSAMWGPDRKVMYTVMRREDDEVFVINYMEPMGEMQIGPVPAFAGQSIQFDVSDDGLVVVSVQGFEFIDSSQIPPELMVDGKATKPWRNGLFALTLDETGRATSIPLFVDQPDLGIAPEDMTDALRTSGGIPAAVNGIVAVDVAPNSIAGAVGLKPGDVVTSIAGTPTPDLTAMFTALRNVRFGIPTQISFWSKEGKAMKTISVTFGNESAMCLKDPAIAPDSKSVAAVVGMVDRKYYFNPLELVIVPIQPAGLNNAKRLIAGRVFQPNWHVSGSKLTFGLVSSSGDSQIYTVNADGSGQRNVSGPGNFGSPKFSPYVKK